jgi:hypothetical protein
MRGKRHWINAHILIVKHPHIGVFYDTELDPVCAMYIVELSYAQYHMTLVLYPEFVL